MVNRFGSHIRPFTVFHKLKKSCLHNQCRQDFYFITLLNQNATFLAT